MYDDVCLSRSNVFLWYKRFLNGRESLKGDEHTGRSISIQKSEMIEKVILLQMPAMLH